MLVITLLQAAELLINDIDFSISSMLIRINSMEEGCNENIMSFNKLAHVASMLKHILTKFPDHVFC